MEGFKYWTKYPLDKWKKEQFFRVATTEGKTTKWNAGGQRELGFADFNVVARNLPGSKLSKNEITTRWSLELLSFTGIYVNVTWPLEKSAIEKSTVYSNKSVSILLLRQGLSLRLWFGMCHHTPCYNQIANTSVGQGQSEISSTKVIIFYKFNNIYFCSIYNINTLFFHIGEPYMCYIYHIHIKSYRTYITSHVI